MAKRKTAPTAASEVAATSPSSANRSQKRKVEPPSSPPPAAAVPAATPAKSKPAKKQKTKRRAAAGPTATESGGVLAKDGGFRGSANVVVNEEKDAEELELEDLVFGGDLAGRVQSILGRVGRTADAEEEMIDDEEDESGAWLGAEAQSDEDEDLGFTIDTDGRQPAEDDDSADVDGHETALSTELSTAVPAAWHDDDEVPVDIVSQKRLRKLRSDYSETTLSSAEYEARLRRQFERIHPTPLWAELAGKRRKGESSSDDLLRVLRTATGIVDRKAASRILNPDSLEVVRLKDANQMAYSQAVVQCVQFHPKAPVLLTGGFDKTLRLFQVDGKVNPKLQSVYIKDLPIVKASFTPDGNEIVISGRRNFFYTYDVEKGVVNRISRIRGHDEENLSQSFVSPDNKYLVFAGRDGRIMVLSNATKQWIGDLKMNGTVKTVDFSADGRSLYSFGGDGEVYNWDLGSRRCVHRFFDEGCVNATALAISGGSGYIATGSESGVVNLYKQATALASSNPAPEKAIYNLTTSISRLRFNHDAQILAMASRDKKDSLRLLHVPTRRVFKNWPTAQTPLGYVNSLDFSPGGGFLAAGNDKGKVLLYRLNAYDAL
ncbi:U3 snoRNP protein [Geranomyces michiganensis]|nr:U3 snoRNP protein [Geranomyces michiganensis]